MEHQYPFLLCSVGLDRMSFVSYQPSMFETAINKIEMNEDSNIKLIKTKKGTGLLPPINQRFQKEEIHNDLELNDSSDTTIIRPEACADREVPVIKLSKTKTTVTLVDNGKKKSKQKLMDVIARGVLKGTNNLDIKLDEQLDFRGNFKGTFEKDEQVISNIIEYYFEGEITELKILRIGMKEPSEEQQLELVDLTVFKGYFKGIFIPVQSLQANLKPKQSFGYEQQLNIDGDLLKKSKPKVEYHVPTMVRFDVRKISQINLEKSSAEISAILYIDVQLTDEVMEVVYNEKEGKFRSKYKLAIDFHRSKPLVLPFYNQQDEPETDEEQQYEWDDVWEGIDMEAEWKHSQRRMSYYIRMTYTAEIDNSHGIFYAPFNLNFLRIIVDLHAIKIDSNTRLCLNCCNLTDFNTSTPNTPYTPYTFFQHLQRKLDPKYGYSLAEPRDHPSIYQKHIDRLTKIDVTHFVDQGQFKIANNRLSLFPYHRRVIRNKNELTADFGWTLGSASRSKLLETPKVVSVRQGFDGGGKSSVFEAAQWEFVHIDLPIFKYPVIDMIRIFVPIIILSAISMTIFAQENATDSNGFTELAKRIASGCSLMIAYVALIPMIRGNLPPTPSVTLVEILIYLSVIPNFLAIISVFFCTSLNYLDFFSNYQPFIDGFFLVSFFICCLSFIALLIVMLVYARKDYKSDFTIYKFRTSPMRNLRAPVFLSYMENIKNKRTKDEITIEEFPVPYETFGSDDGEE